MINMKQTALISIALLVFFLSGTFALRIPKKLVGTECMWPMKMGLSRIPSQIWSGSPGRTKTQLGRNPNRGWRVSILERGGECQKWVNWRVYTKKDQGSEI